MFNDGEATENTLLWVNIWQCKVAMYFTAFSLFIHVLWPIVCKQNNQCIGEIKHISKTFDMT